MDSRHVPVLIVGGGPVGLALASDLGWRGIRCELIEQSDGAIATPKMNEVNTRTMEFCRRWGIAERVRNCPFPDDWPLDIVFVTSLAGYEFGADAATVAHRTGADALQPGAAASVLADVVRPDAARLRAIVSERPTAIPHASWKPSRTAATASPPSSSTRRPARARRMTADYLVACDGANSMVRNALGIGLTGKGVLGHPLQPVFPRARPAASTAARSPARSSLPSTATGLWANIRIVDPANGLWRIMVLDTDGQRTPETIDRDALVTPRGRAADRGGMGGAQYLDPPQRGRRALLQGPRVPRRRRRASAVADRRARHEHRHQRRRRSRLEARGDHRWLGRAGAAREL